MTRKWDEEAAKYLKGRTIVEARYMTEEEAKEFGYYHRAVVLKLDNGTLFWPTADDEGNDAGALHGSAILPVL